MSSNTPERRAATAILAKANPGRPDRVAMYVDQFLAYRQADLDIEARGQVVDGQQNPSLIIRQAARRGMLEIGLKGTARLWEIFEAALDVELRRV